VQLCPVQPASAFVHPHFVKNDTIAVKQHCLGLHVRGPHLPVGRYPGQRPQQIEIGKCPRQNQAANHKTHKVHDKLSSVLFVSLAVERNSASGHLICIVSFGISPNISGEYIASTRGRRQIHRPFVIQPDRVFNRPCPLRKIVIIGAVWLQRAFFECRLDPAAIVLVARCKRRIASQAAAEYSGPGRDGIGHDCPRHVGLGFNFQFHPHEVAPGPDSAFLLFDRGHGLF